MAHRQGEPFEPTQPSAGQPAAIQAAFTSLRSKFVVGLTHRWQEIETAANREAQRAALHRLAGAAGSYGLVDVGEAARRAEALNEANDVAALQLVLQELRQALVSAGATLS